MIIRAKVVLENKHGRHLGFHDFWGVPESGDIFFLNNDITQGYSVMYKVHYRSELVIVAQSLEED